MHRPLCEEGTLGLAARRHGGAVGEAEDQMRVVQRVLGDSADQPVVVGADDDVAELRAAGALGVGEDVTEAVGTERQQRRDELPSGHVDRHALGLELERGPVEAGAADELVHSANAEHDVVAAEALHDRALAGDHHVVAVVEGQLAGGRADVASQVVAAVLTADQPVVALIADKFVSALPTEHDVIAGSAL